MSERDATVCPLQPRALTPPLQPLASPPPLPPHIAPRIHPSIQRRYFARLRAHQRLLSRRQRPTTSTCHRSPALGLYQRQWKLQPKRQPRATRTTTWARTLCEFSVLPATHITVARIVSHAPHLTIPCIAAGLGTVPDNSTTRTSSIAAASLIQLASRYAVTLRVCAFYGILINIPFIACAKFAGWPDN